MTTTTSTTSTTSTPTPTPASTTSAISTATQQLLTSLGSGSGVDTGSLVTSLVQAEFAARTDALTTKSDTLTSEISGASTLMSTITQFDTALKGLVTGGTLTTQPVSSDSGVLGATALPGAQLANLSRSVTVSQLAAGQSVRTLSPAPDRTTAIGSGDFTLSVGTPAYNTDGTLASVSGGKDFTFSVTNGSLDDIAKAITNSGAGVTASVVTDAGGSAYLSIKGQTGAAQAFTLTQTSGDAALAQFQVGGGATNTVLTGTAANAKLTVDGVSVERSSNTVSDLIDGVKLQLSSVSTTPVTLTSTTPTSALSGAVSDFVDTYNEVLAAVKAQTDPATGALRADSAAQALQRQLGQLTAQPLLSGAASGTPTTLAEIGVVLNKDGTLSVDDDTLSNALATWPDSVEAMFAYDSTGTSGLLSALDGVTTAANSTVYGLGASSATYTAQKDDIADQQTDLATKSSDETTRLTQQFADMNSKVSAYKSTQAFLTQQVDAWNKSDS